MKLDRDSSTPLYKQVKFYLQEYIQGKDAQNPQIPTEEEVSRLLNVSRGTVKIAMKELVQEGILKRVPGKGTFIDIPSKKISFATWLSLEEYTAPPLFSAVNSYLKLNKEIAIETNSIPYEKYEHQLMLMTAAGKAPDIASLVYLWLPAFAHQEAILPIDNLQSRGMAQTIYPSSLEAASYHGRQYGFTLANGPSILFHNKDVLEEYYGESEPVIEEYSHFIDIFARLHDKSRGAIIPLSIPIGDDELFFLYSIYNFLLAFGGGIIDKEGAVNFHSEKNISAYKWLKKFISHGFINTENSFREERRLFAYKKIAFSIEAPWLKGIIPTLNPAYPMETLGFQKLPKGPAGIHTSILYNIILSIFKQNTEPKEAADFAAFLCRDSASCERFYTKAGLLPAYRDIIQSSDVYNDPFGKVLQAQMESAEPVPSNHPSFLLSIVFCAKASRDILLGDKEPAQVLNSTAEILRELYRQ